MKEKFTQGDWSVHNPRLRRPSLNPRAPSDGRYMVIHPDGERVLAVCNIGYCGRDGSIPLEEREPRLAGFFSCRSVRVDSALCPTRSVVGSADTTEDS